MKKCLVAMLISLAMANPALAAEKSVPLIPEEKTLNDYLKQGYTVVGSAMHIVIVKKADDIAFCPVNMNAGGNMMLLQCRKEQGS